MRNAILRLALGLLIGTAAVWAHHSFAAEFDGNAPITIKGKIKHVDWVNPHSWLHVDVVGADGKVTTWRCETAPPNGLMRRGWTKKSIPEGLEVTVEGFRAKDGSPTMNARSVTMPDGKRMFAGSSGDGAPVREGEPKQ